MGIYDCVNAFSRLLNVEYNIVIGRKGKTTNLQIAFNKDNCFHLMGLQHLKDIANLNRNKDIIFDEIQNHKITQERIERSVFYKSIEERINLLPHLETIMDDNNLIFKYNKNTNNFSFIDADYLFSSLFEEREIYVFLSKYPLDEKYHCKSFFPKSQRDYTKGQTKFTLLYKEKINIATNERVVQYDRLNRAN
jgi:hypothetical protein